MPEISRQPVARYAIAVAASFMALGLRVGLDPWLRHVSPFMLFVPAMMLGAWYGGLNSSP